MINAHPYLIALGMMSAFTSLAYVVFGTVMRRRLLHGIVFSNLDSAAENGYFAPGEQLADASPAEIAEDMQVYGDCEDYTVAELVSYVREWLHERGGR